MLIGWVTRPSYWIIGSILDKSGSTRGCRVCDWAQERLLARVGMWVCIVWLRSQVEVCADQTGWVEDWRGISKAWPSHGFQFPLGVPQ
jgi:hypothetical protein